MKPVLQSVHSTTKSRRVRTVTRKEFSIREILVGLGYPDAKTYAFRVGVVNRQVGDLSAVDSGEYAVLAVEETTETEETEETAAT